MQQGLPRHLARPKRKRCADGMGRRTCCVLRSLNVAKRLAATGGPGAHLCAADELAAGAAAAVAAHECGHAVQHATAYGPLEMRSKLVPAVQFSSMIVNWVLLIGVVMAASGNTTLLLIGIILMAVTVVFSLITLPVEFDASKRALAWLQHTNVTNNNEYPQAKDALKWAATTYVVAALAAVVTLVQYIMIYLGGRRD